MAADWSGARTGEDRHLWVAEWDPGAGTSGAVVSVRGMTRTAATDRLIDLADQGGGLVAGLDFGFSLPAWWLEANRIRSAAELWADAARLEGWLAGCATPFWGRPGRRRPDLGGRAEWRLTELAAPVRPRSVFQISGAGAVGTASLRGMPTLDRLRTAGWSVWPFDPWSPPVAVEVWPRLAMGRTVKSSAAARAEWVDSRRGDLEPGVAATATASPDAFDAVAAVLHLAARRNSPRPSFDDPVIALEGWIDGVSEQSAPLSRPRSVGPAQSAPLSRPRPVGLCRLVGEPLLSGA